MTKKITPEYKTYLAQPYHTSSMCWLNVRKDGYILAVTERDTDIPFDLGAAMITQGLDPVDWIVNAGPQTYLAASGFTSKDIATNSGLNVDTGEAIGMLRAPAITVEDMLAGLWDYTQIAIFEVNAANLAIGCLVERVGAIGEINTDLGYFRAEWRGLFQQYQKTIGRLTLPMCNANLGDARCKLDLTPFMHTGTLTGVNPDRLTLYDTSRTEAGPVGSVNITNITNANPGIVTVDDASTLANGMAVALSEIDQPAVLNTTALIRNLSGLTWSVGEDTTLLPAYTHGGKVTPFGATSGYFGLGLIKFTTGANAGRTFEIKSYVPGQFVLQLPLPYDAQIGDRYIATAGCDKSQNTCKTRYNNLINNRGFFALPGLDKIMGVGRKQ